ncbi:MAG: hypothetical protein AAFT19_07345 [Pseudomonadota bacterium]
MNIEVSAEPHRARTQEAPVLPAAVPRRRFGWAIAGFFAFVVLPTAAAGWYWTAIAADRYVSSLRYAIRGGAAPDQPEGRLSLASPALAGAQAEGFILEDFLRSDAAVAALEERLPLRAMLGRDGGDPVRRFDPAMAREDLRAFWNAALALHFDMVTGITAVEVRLFRPEDSLAVAGVLVEILRDLVDQLSERQQAQMLAYVEREFHAAGLRLQQSLDAIEAFRRRTLTVSPTDEAALNAAMIARLTEERTGLEVRLRTLRETVPNSPQIPRLSEQMAALQAQIASTRAMVGGAGTAPAALVGGGSPQPAPQPAPPGAWAAGDGSAWLPSPAVAAEPGATLDVARPGGTSAERALTGGALPHRLTTFERLQNEYQIALDSYVTTLALRQEAQASATLGQVHLVVFVPPRSATTATAPDRIGSVAMVFGVAFICWVIARILLASLRTP